MYSFHTREECTVRVQAKMEDGTNCSKGGAKLVAYFVDDSGQRIDSTDFHTFTHDNSDGTYLVSFEVIKVACHPAHSLALIPMIVICLL